MAEFEFCSYSVFLKSDNVNPGPEPKGPKVRIPVENITYLKGTNNYLHVISGDTQKNTEPLPSEGLLVHISD